MKTTNCKNNEHDESTKQNDIIAETMRPSAAIEEMIRQSERWSEIVRSSALERISQMAEIGKAQAKLLAGVQTPLMGERILRTLNNFDSLALKPPLIGQSVMDIINTIGMKSPLFDSKFLDNARSMNASATSFIGTMMGIYASALSAATRLALHNESLPVDIGAMAQNWARIGTNASTLSRYYESLELDCDDEHQAIDEFSDDDINELGKAIHSIVTSTDDLVETCETQVEAISKRNPQLAKIMKFIVLQIISFLIWQLAGYAMNHVITHRNAPLREQASSTSIVINNVTINQHLFVVDSVPYYYFVEFESPETGDMVQGYISKRSVRPMSPK